MSAPVRVTTRDFYLPDLQDTPGREPYCTRPGCGLPVATHRGGHGQLEHDATVGVLIPGHPVELGWRPRENAQVQA